RTLKVHAYYENKISRNCAPDEVSDAVEQRKAQTKRNNITMKVAKYTYGKTARSDLNQRSDCMLAKTRCFEIEILHINRKTDTVEGEAGENPTANNIHRLLGYRGTFMAYEEGAHLIHRILYQTLTVPETFQSFTGVPRQILLPIIYLARSGKYGQRVLVFGGAVVTISSSDDAFSYDVTRQRCPNLVEKRKCIIYV
ncbi:hypothetical protein CSKR_111728, partial [Clonorchis sinensis]